MTHEMMTWLNSHMLTWPTALAAAGITVPILVAMYFLKLRRRLVVVSSTLLWKRAVQDLQVNAPFQKIRRNLLLLLQLLALLGLLLALARPTFKGSVQAGERIVIIVDQSASMNATDVSPSRLARAKDQAVKLVDSLEGGSAMVVSFAHQARVVQTFTTDRTLLREKIRGIEPTDQFSELGSALRLIEPYCTPPESAGAAKPAAAMSVYVFSDGRLTSDQDLMLSGGKITLEPIRQEGKDPPIDNLAIVSLSASRDPDRPQIAQVFVGLANYGDQSVRTNLLLTTEGLAPQVRAIEVPAARPAPPPDPTPGVAPGAAPGATPGVNPGTAAKPGNPSSPVIPGKRAEIFDLLVTGSAFVTVGHDHQDQLLADNTASILLEPPQQPQVLLVTTGNAFLQRALESLPRIKKVVVMTAKKYEDQDIDRLRRGAAGPDEGFDVIVFDGHDPKVVPPVDSLYFGCNPPIPGLSRLPTAANQPRTQVFLDWDPEHPVLANVNLEAVRVYDPGRLALPRRARALANCVAGPVLAEVPYEGTRHLVASFDILKTNWPVIPSFIPFMANAIEQLAQRGAGGGLAYRPGDVAVVPVDGAAPRVTFNGPVALAAGVEQGRATLPIFTRVGVYTSTTGAAPPFDRLAVNLANEVESDLHPADRLQVAQATNLTATEAGAFREEAWRWFMWAALAMLLVEWVVYTRRMHL
jgi:hypothetical protein